MQGVVASSQRVRFGDFEFDSRSEELHKCGTKIKLQGQPLKILAILLAHRGELVTRDTLRQELWPEDTFVDFETGLNSTILKLRQALGDSADKPRFVETLPRRGYRFIGPIAATDPPLSASDSVANTAEASPDQHAHRRWLMAVGVVVVSAFALLLIVVGNIAGMRQRLFGNAPSSGGETPRPIRSVAVLPLENLSSDPQQEYFAEGITEELTTDLAKIGALKIISRTSAMRLKSTKKPLPQIARELNVDAVVEGSVERSGTHVRIIAQLIDAANDRHLWAESYDRDARDVLALQSEVARAIASAIRIKLTPQEQARLAKARLVDVEAEEAYLRGRYELGRWTVAGFKNSFGYFHQAVQEDPALAQAWAGLAETYYELALSGSWPPAETRAKAKAAAEKALQLDDTLSEAHVSLAMLELGAGRAANSLKELQRALALDPNNARAHQIYGRYLLSRGRLQEAIVELQRAEELDPLTPKMKNNLAVAYFFAGHDDEALRWYRQVSDPDLDSERRHRRMAEIYERKGLQKEAMSELLRSLRFGDKAQLALAVQRTYESSGYAEAKKMLLRGEIVWAETRVNRKRVPDNAYWIARDYAILGNKDKAFEWLATALQNRSSGQLDFQTDPQLSEFRADPRVQDLLQRARPPQ